MPISTLPRISGRAAVKRPNVTWSRIVCRIRFASGGFPPQSQALTFRRGWFTVRRTTDPNWAHTRPRHSLSRSIGRGSNSNQPSHPERTPSTIPAPSSTRRCLAIACRVNVEPSLNWQSNVAAAADCLDTYRDIDYLAAAGTSRGGPIRDIVRTIGRPFEQGPIRSRSRGRLSAARRANGPCAATRLAMRLKARQHELILRAAPPSVRYRPRGFECGDSH
jgi:hypothetical protein